jgi:hypothetical protein
MSHDHDHTHDHGHGHGGSPPYAPDADDLIAVLRSAQADLDGVSDETAARFDEVAAGIAALGFALREEKGYAAHLKGHYIDCEASASYRLGHAIIVTAKAPKRLVDSVRSRR